MNCEECTLDGIRVPPYIPLEPVYDLMIVGQAPGKTEVTTKQPFTGDAGKMLYALLREAMLDKRNLYLTNLVMCKPPTDTKGNDKEPSPREILNCFPRLYEEIQQQKPKLLVALGNPAMYALTGHDGIQSAHGKFFKLLPKYDHDAWVLCCFHPSFVMRQRQWIQIAVKDLKQIHDFYIHGAPVSESPTFIMDPSYSELHAYLFKDTKGKIIAFDTETTGLNTRLDSVLGFSFSRDDMSACAIYLKPSDNRIVLIDEWLSNGEYLKCTQNGSFDCEILFNNLGISVNGLKFDTRLAEQLLHSDMPTNLDHLRATYTDIEPYKPTKKEMKDVASWGKERMLTYACWDALTTYRVMLKQKKLLTPEQVNLLDTHLIPLTFVINKMVRKGILVNVNTLAGMYAQHYPRMKELRNKVINTYGISPTSPKQITAYLKLNDASRDTLEYYIRRGDPRSEAMQDILNARNEIKICSTYLKGLYDQLEDGYAHTDLKLDGTGTGRLSSSKPALQNTPKWLRVVYEAEPGHYLLAGDYNQLELWVGSILAPCEALQRDLQAGVDVHSLVAEEIKPYVNQRLLNQLRLTAKTIVFGTFYGRTARSIAVTFGVSVAEAEKWQSICFTRYPGLKKYIQDRQNDFNTKGYVTTPWGRLRYVNQVTQAFNTPVQSSASDVTLSTMLVLDHMGYDLRLNVHDEIVLQVKREDLYRDYVHIKSVFQRPISVLNNTCFPASFKYGENWYDMTPIV